MNDFRRSGRLWRAPLMTLGMYGGQHRISFRKADESAMR